jgi:hypothetical protein
MLKNDSFALWVSSKNAAIILNRTYCRFIRKITISISTVGAKIAVSYKVVLIARNEFINCRLAIEGMQRSSTTTT